MNASWAGAVLFSGCPGKAEARAQASCGFAVTEKAEGAEIVEIALASAFGYGEDMVGIPETAAAADGLETVEAEACGTGGTTGALKCGVGGGGVDVTDGAAATVAGEDLVA
jgi:hypothetical protein